MKKIENNFTVSGFVGKDAEIRQFANASVARFSLAVGRQEKNGEETNRVSAFMNMEDGARTSTPNHSTSSQKARCSPSRVSSSQRNGQTRMA